MITLMTIMTIITLITIMTLITLIALITLIMITLMTIISIITLTQGKPDVVCAISELVAELAQKSPAAFMELVGKTKTWVPSDVEVYSWGCG